MAMVHAMENLGRISDVGLAQFQAVSKTYDTHALPGSNEGCNTNHETNGREYSPASTSVTESDENGTNDTTKDSGDTETTGKDDTGRIAVANGPPNEVRMGLVT